jgi:hypothetical protein
LIFLGEVFVAGEGRDGISKGDSYTFEMLGYRGPGVPDGWKAITDKTQKNALVEAIRSCLNDSEKIAFNDFNEFDLSSGEVTDDLKINCYILRVYPESGYTVDLSGGIAFYEFRGKLRPLEQGQDDDNESISRCFLFGKIKSPDKDRPEDNSRIEFIEWSKFPGDDGRVPINDGLVAALLSGASPPIHFVNRMAPIDLVNATHEAVLDYLRMFCEFVTGGESPDGTKSPFYIIDSPDELKEVSRQPTESELSSQPPSAAEVSPTPSENSPSPNETTTTTNESSPVTKWEIEWKSPPKITHERSSTDRPWQVEACIMYLNQGFLARFSIEDNGTVAMKEDEPRPEATGWTVAHERTFYPVDRSLDLGLPSPPPFIQPPTLKRAKEEKDIRWNARKIREFYKSKKTNPQQMPAESEKQQSQPVNDGPAAGGAGN